jgi:hypothetical protein
MLPFTHFACFTGLRLNSFPAIRIVAFTVALLCARYDCFSQLNYVQSTGVLVLVYSKKEAHFQCNS